MRPWGGLSDSILSIGGLSVILASAGGLGKCWGRGDRLGTALPTPFARAGLRAWLLSPGLSGRAITSSLCVCRGNRSPSGCGVVASGAVWRQETARWIRVATTRGARKDIRTVSVASGQVPTITVPSCGLAGLT